MTLIVTLATAFTSSAQWALAATTLVPGLILYFWLQDHLAALGYE